MTNDEILDLLTALTRPFSPEEGGVPSELPQGLCMWCEKYVGFDTYHPENHSADCAFVAALSIVSDGSRLRARENEFKDMLQLAINSGIPECGCPHLPDDKLPEFHVENCPRCKCAALIGEGWYLRPRSLERKQ